LRLDPYKISCLRTAFYKRCVPLLDATCELGEHAQPIADKAIRPTEFELETREDSQVDGATKLALKTHDGHLIETVILRIKSGRTALCVSSQVGCAADCSFCATGKMGITRNLTAFEIVDQVAIANRILKGEGRRVRNLVFMGMGEPFHNSDEVDHALDMLTDPTMFNLAPGHITVSTVGIPEEMTRLAAARPEIHIALSLHSARQDRRVELIPLAHKYDSEALRKAVKELNRLQQRPVMIEYLMLAEFNDTPDDLDALLQWVDGLNVHVNLIPFNTIAGMDHLKATPKSQRAAFSSELRARGIKTTLRYSLGADVTAACGQLVREEKRRR
jgi:23S rRNA (adenine2503-C2)-methyltransferase